MNLNDLGLGLGNISQDIRLVLEEEGDNDTYVAGSQADSVAGSISSSQARTGDWETF